MKLSLSQKLALVMVGMVLLTGLMTVALTNYIVNEQARDLDQRIEKARTNTQQWRTAFGRGGRGTSGDVRKPEGDGARGPGGVPVQVAPIESPDSVVAGFKAELQSGKSVDEVMNEVKDRLAYYQSPPVAFQTVTATLSSNNGESFISSSFSNLILEPLRRPIFIGVALLALVAAGLSLFLAHTVVRPLKALQGASARIAAGNYDLEIRPQGDSDMSRLAFSFNRMAEALRNAERMRKEQIANVTHELRTPLTAVQGYTEALRDGVASGDHVYGRILSEIRFMTKMVTSLREWSNASAALEKMHPEPLPAFLVACEVTDRFVAEAANREVVLDVRRDGQPLSPDDSPATLPPSVVADPDAFRTILGNLIDNALRYTPAGGRITTSITTQTTPLIESGGKTRAKDTSGWAVFRVSDTGVGIPAEHLPHIFERFYRVDKSRDRETGGTGLGLALVRDAVYALGGDIAISSSIGDGTTVSFSLPLAK